MSMNEGGNRRELACVYGATIVIWLAFDRMAAVTESTSGEAGIAIAVVVTAALLGAERIVHGRSPVAAWRALGCGAPQIRGMVVAAVISAVLLAVLPVAARITATPLALRSDWPKFVPGLFAQAGLAEELLFRGYLFGTLRHNRSFWRAALLAVPPFLLVHLLLFATMSFPVAASATLLSVVVSFPLARLYDLGGATVWAPAIVHAVIQGGIKIVEIPEERMIAVATVWMAASMVVPWLAFAVRSTSTKLPRGNVIVSAGCI